MRKILALLIFALLVGAVPVAAQEDTAAAEFQQQNTVLRMFSTFSTFASCESASITSFSFPSEAEAGDTVEVSMTAENTGSCTLSDFEVEIDVDESNDGDEFYRDATVLCSNSGSVSPGETLSCSGSFGMPSNDARVWAFASQFSTFFDDDGPRTISVTTPDNTDPDVDIDAPSSLTSGETFSYQVEATDNKALDSIDTSESDSEFEDCNGQSTCTLDGSDVAPSSGTWELTALATDQAGNTASDSVDVTVEEEDQSAAGMITSTATNVVLSIVDFFNVL